MLGFLIKKTFFDLWDNLLVSVALNAGFIVVCAVPVLVPSRLAPVSPAASVISFLVGALLVFLYLGVVSLYAKDMTDYKSIEIRAFGSYLTQTAPSSLFFGLVWLLHVFLLGTGIPFYSSMNNVFGGAATVLLFWAGVLWSLASVYYLPVRARLDRSVIKVLKKSFLLFFDNPGFTVYLAIGLAGIIALSFSTPLFLAALPAGMIWIHAGVKIRLLKYDYLEENPEARRNRIPWNALLIEEREKIGKRTLRGFIFPWKD
jgi:uncharacterized membrane protein YesL